MLDPVKYEFIAPFVAGLLIGTGISYSYRNIRLLLSGPLNTLSMNNKLVLVVRSDLKMSKGKVAAQCSHASVECYKAALQHKPQMAKMWQITGQKKIVVSIDNGENGLAELSKVAKSYKVLSCIISDAGATQVKAGTPTVIVQRYLTTMHSNILTKDFGKFKIQVLPALSDNFMYLLIDNGTKEAAIVDPVAPNVVWDAVRKENIKLTTVLTTHHHWDHAGGNKELISGNTNNPLTVIGGDVRIDGLTVMIDKQGVDLQLGSLNIKCLRTPCHTTGHVCYYVSAGQEGVVFTGDTLFLGGCGRFFEGNATQMYEALINTLSQLPDSTAVFCGHEYAIQNLKFGLHIEPFNQDILSQLAQIETKRETKEPSVPSTIGLEKLINPFMRVEKEAVQKVTQTIGDPIETMRILREMKNNL